MEFKSNEELVNEFNDNMDRLKREFMGEVVDDNTIYHTFRAEIESKCGTIDRVTVSTVDIMEACRMVEDTGLDGGEIIRIIKI